MTERPEFSAAITNTASIAQLSDQDFWHYASELAKADIAPPVPLDEYLVCQSEQVRSIFPLRCLREIVTPPQHYTLLPDIPFWMNGITLWRGEVVPVIDLAAFFMQHQAYTNATSLLIASIDDNTLGLLTTITDELPALSLDALQPFNEPARFPCPEAILGEYEGNLVFDMPSLLAALVHLIKVTSDG
ncbi:MAG TPA: chemotaxis protein CheW [Dictyobacter sp.]|jgi:chemotaxis signal transduction protein|nr:chemotaxis protein CheW [Dictyobacter sp.]